MITTENSNDIYIGSTIRTLKKRLQEHETKYRNDIYCSSSEIIKQGNYKIVLIKNFACHSKTELEFEETKYQRDLICVNRRLGRLREDERKENKKQYYIDNKDEIRENQKQYRIDNKDKIKQYRIDNKDEIKQYRIDNKDKIKQYRIDSKDKIRENQKQYYIENKQKLNQKFTCACGGRYLYRTKSRHFKSLKHNKYLKSKTKYIFKIKRVNGSSI